MTRMDRANRLPFGAGVEGLLSSILTGVPRFDEGPSCVSKRGHFIEAAATRIGGRCGRTTLWRCPRRRRNIKRDNAGQRGTGP